MTRQVALKDTMVKKLWTELVEGETQLEASQ